ncbi:MAG: hypothetical protein J5966_05540 [Lachnospiraceae bacterium]|nr:hypothetical protein [Lachnospiraceae bacterium]
MKIIKGVLFSLLAAILLLCGIISLSALRPDLFDRFRQEGDSAEETAGPPVYTLPSGNSTSSGDPEAKKPSVSEDTVSGDGAIDDSYFAEDVPDSGLKRGIEPVYSNDSPPADVPGSLRSQTGLTEPHGTYDILDDDKADELEASLSTGPTGDDLDFDAEFYPYYHMLDPRGQHLYRQIYANARELNPDFRAVEKDMPWASFRNVFEAVFNDHPELFWLNTEYSSRYRNNGECLEIILSFNRTAQDLEGSAANFDAGAEKIGNAAYGNEYEQEKAVHDAILNAFTYNLSAEMNQSAYSGFVNNSTVCAGYARSFQYIMQQLGIPCYYCRGVAGEPHAWNIIKLGGDYYNVDATWDDSDQTWQYEYFNLSDAELNADHRRTSLSVYLPACNGGQYSHLETKPEEEAPVPDQPEDAQAAELPDGIYVGSREEYFAQCIQAISENGKGSYSFDLYTTDKNVYNSCMSAYADGSARDEYMGDAFDSIENASGLSVDFIGTEGNGVYKMTQKVRLW